MTNMVDTISSVKGAVLFIDLLGMGILTISDGINEEILRPWSNSNISSYKDAAAIEILTAFRKVLDDLRKNFHWAEDDSRIIQVSDGAFIWSTDLKELLKFTKELMYNLIAEGVFARGGISYGDIYIPSLEREIGPFIVGEAVSKAVKLEGSLKGARISLCDQLMKRIDKVNFTVNDSELEWWIDPQSMKETMMDAQYKAKINDWKNEILENLKDEKFDWNKVGKGLEHYDETINIISGNDAVR